MMRCNLPLETKDSKTHTTTQDSNNNLRLKKTENEDPEKWKGFLVHASHFYTKYRGNKGKPTLTAVIMIENNLAHVWYNLACFNSRGANGEKHSPVQMQRLKETSP